MHWTFSPLRCARAGTAARSNAVCLSGVRARLGRNSMGRGRGYASWSVWRMWLGGVS